ncbi:hypothetical protein GL218_00723 [Daldinia childiae]|uniref:uncharacterized protein n=1 Tax=Daldinia childiae TaxID=326645 RepID=UPI00144894F0|nr:uncharacterized protein GL218_00723 [Daldinia childiae]KAF3070534.1 hypothetical protein GL218_00723 [Daldinia childiae]
MSASSKLPPEAVKQQVPESRKEPVRDDTPISELDPKLLLLGDFAENGTWWTGGQEEVLPSKTPSRRKDDAPSIVSSRSPRIDWGVASEWYHMVVNAAQLWPEATRKYLYLSVSVLTDAKLFQFESLAISAQEHIQQVLLSVQKHSSNDHVG